MEIGLGERIVGASATVGVFKNRQFISGIRLRKISSLDIAE